MAVDHAHNRHTPGVPIIKLDLAAPHSWDLLYRLVEQKKILYVHGGPPCGTATRARDRPVPKRLRMRGAPDPRPLRSEAHPLGFPELLADHPDESLRVASEKVKKANCIYNNMAKFFEFCIDQAVYFTVENPSRSYMWLTPAFKELCAKPDSSYRFPAMHARRQQR